MTLSHDLRSDQLAPHSIESEEAVLGAILIQPEALLEVRGFLRAEDFFLVRHGWIWETVNRLHERKEPIDYLTVVSELEQAGRLSEAGGAAYILSLINKTPSALNVEGYGRVVERMAVRRRLIDGAQRIVRAAHSDETDIQEVVRQSEAALREAVSGYRRKRMVTVSAAQLSDDLIREADIWAADPRWIRGWKSGIKDLDYAINGWEPEMYYELLGRPGMGKSLLAGWIAYGLASNGVRVMVFSLETAIAEYQRRIAAQLGRVSLTDIRRGRADADGLLRYKQKLAEIKTYPTLTFVRGDKLTTQDIRDKVDQHITEQGGLDFVIIDTVDLIYDPELARNRYVGMTNIITDLMQWANNSPFGVLGAVQIRRPGQGVSVKEPTLDDAKDTGAHEQASSVMLGLHRPGYYAPDDESLRHEAQVRILKNRYGAAGGKVVLHYDSDWPGFAETTHTGTVDLDAGIYRGGE